MPQPNASISPIPITTSIPVIAAHRQTRGWTLSDWKLIELRSIGNLRHALMPDPETSLVSRASPVHAAMRNCTRDEGGTGFGNQVPISSHRKLRSPKAMVVNVAETSGRDPGRHGRERRAQANRCRSVESGLGDVRTGG